MHLKMSNILLDPFLRFLRGCDLRPLLCALVLAAWTHTPLALSAPGETDNESTNNAKAFKSGYFKPESATNAGTVTVEGTRVDYDSIAGTLFVHPKGWDDAAPPDGQSGQDRKSDLLPAEASMFYVAYFKRGAEAGKTPVTFLYNGGPGSSTVWLHMGAFGPRRVVTADDSHTPAAPYSVVNNDYSLLDATDLVFVDAPGTGFSRLSGKDKEKAFYGVDQDAWAFSDFIVQFLAKYGRWNSPKFLFGESYGTTRSAVLANLLETDRSVDFNGVILLSQILNFSLDSDLPEVNPGIDTAYQLVLPT